MRPGISKRTNVAHSWSKKDKKLFQKLLDHPKCSSVVSFAPTMLLPKVRIPIAWFFKIKRGRKLVKNHPWSSLLLEGYIGPSGSKLLCLWQTQKLWSTCVATFHTCLSVGPIRLYPRAPWIIKLYHLLINTKRFVVVVGDEKSVSKIEIWIIFLEELFNHPASLPLLLLFRQRRLR